MGGSLSVDRELIQRRVCGVAEPSVNSPGIVFGLVPRERDIPKAIRFGSTRLVPV
jgi:hypothetical protein|eukprot:COSAG01_NODE_4673_length_4826_cov_29.270150_2_plen_55_part_00